VVQKKGESL
jgi:hypothetical protein